MSTPFTDLPRILHVFHFVETHPKSARRISFAQCDFAGEAVDGMSCSCKDLIRPFSPDCLQTLLGMQHIPFVIRRADIEFSDGHCQDCFDICFVISMILSNCAGSRGVVRGCATFERVYWAD